MKRTTLILVAFALIFGIFAAIPVAAAESDLYYINVPILKIFPHRMGYYVIYRRTGLQTGEFFIPNKWFDRRDQRAIFTSTSANINPYLSIVMKKGEFEHVTIVAAKNVFHPTWGVLSGSASQYDANFNIEKLDPKF